MAKRHMRSKLKPKTPRTGPSPQAKQWAAGLSAVGNERWEEAVVILKKFLHWEKDPVMRLPVYYNLAHCYLEHGLYDEALATWAQIADLAPDAPDWRFGQATVYGCSGQPEKAIELLEEFQRLMPAKAAQLEVARLIEDLQQEQRGEVVPGAFLYRHLDAQVLNNIDLGDYDLVIRKARQMVAIDSRRPDGHFALGLALLRQNQYAEAMAAFLQAHQLEPDYVPTVYNIGYCCFKSEQFDQAVIWLDRVLQQDKAYLAAYQLMGEVYEQWGQPEKAVAFWQQALSIHPNYEPAQRALFAAGAGPEPEEPSSALTRRLKTMSPWVKARMERPRIYHSGSVTLTVDPAVGFVLEDAENEHNGTVYAGGSFRQGKVEETDVLHFIGVLKLLAQQANKYNCRDMAILVYYPDQPSFSYQLEMREDILQDAAAGRLLSDQAPTFLKVRVDSDLESPYGTPFSGYFIYLAQGQRSGVIVSTLGLLSD